MKINIYPHPWDLRYFQEVALTQNISRAAERLGIGQPALSLSLKRLEELLQVKLFLRRNRGMELTGAGQRLLRQSNQLLANWEAVVSETKRSTSEIVGRFNLGVHSSVAFYALKQVVFDLYSTYPEIEIQLSHNLSRVICEGVISGKFDFGIVVNPIRHPDLVIHHLAKDEVGFWKVAKGISNVLIYNPELTQSQSLIKKSRRLFDFKRTITSDSLEVIATLASSGAGIGILPSRVAKAIAPSLRRIKDSPIFLDDITFVHRVDLPRTAGASCIVNAMKLLEI